MRERGSYPSVIATMEMFIQASIVKFSYKFLLDVNSKAAVLQYNCFERGRECKELVGSNILFVLSIWEKRRGGGIQPAISAASASPCNPFLTLSLLPSLPLSISLTFASPHPSFLLSLLRLTLHKYEKLVVLVCLVSEDENLEKRRNILGNITPSNRDSNYSSRIVFKWCHLFSLSSLMKINIKSLFSSYDEIERYPSPRQFLINSLEKIKNVF